MKCVRRHRRPGATGSRLPASPPPLHLPALLLLASALLALQPPQASAAGAGEAAGESGQGSEASTLRLGTVQLPSGRARRDDVSVASASWGKQGDSIEAAGGRVLEERSYWGSGPHNFTRISFYGDSLTQVGACWSQGGGHRVSLQARC